MNFAYLNGRLQRTHWNDHQRWRGSCLMQAVAFEHPKLGSHVVYMDVAILDEAGIPSPSIYETVARLLEQQTN